MINEAGLNIIKHYEGWSSNVYLDPIGIPTIGYGSIWDINGDRVTVEHPPITRELGTKLLQKEISHIERAIGKLIETYLNDNQFSAVASLTYNIGTGNLQASTLRHYLNDEEFIDAANEFPKWRRAGGQILNGLVKRRNTEQELFMTEIV